MRFMFKLVVWGFIGLMILPSLVETPGNGVSDQSTQNSIAPDTDNAGFSTSDAIYMAAGVAGYLKDICAHDAELCENGARLAEAAFARAQQGAVVLAGMVETHRAKMNDVSDPTTTSSIK